jgi:hypothetical protein
MEAARPFPCEGRAALCPLPGTSQLSPGGPAANPAGPTYDSGVDVMVSPDGHRVERVLVQRSLRRPPKAYLRVRHGSYFVVDCATVAEVAQPVDLASLEPEQVHRRQR